ncbi:hypothetical protein AB0I35_09270 [Nocardia sp. NPDC050378]|uniref:hypothetical protein n=1 Tax=Nocardia sp. NPDC050378 TaxID=3155400 RepID=UPI0033C96C90
MGEKTPWDGAAGKASIRIETGAALQAANACRDVVAVLKGCQELLKPGALNNYSVDALGGDQVHAGPLRTKFIDETRQAYDSVDRFIDSLHDMGDMFKAAGETYTGNDSLSASELAALKDKKTELGQVSTSPPAVNMKDLAAKAPRYLPPDYQTPGGNYTVHDDDIDVAKKPSSNPPLAQAEGADVFKFHAREPASMSWTDLQDLGRRIQWSQVAAEVPTWKVLADQVDKVGTTFQTAVRTITTTNWESKGGEAAFTAVQDFVRSLGSLRDGFLMMHSAVQYTADFLHATAASMPPPADGETCDDVGEIQALYRKHYYDGFEAVQGMFPVAAQPAAPKGELGPPPPQPEKKDPDKNGENNGAGNNGAGNNGAGNNGAGNNGAGNNGGGNNSGGNNGAGNSGAGNSGAGNQSAAEQQQRQALDALKEQRAELLGQQNGQGAQGQDRSGNQNGTNKNTGAGGSGSGSSGSTTGATGGSSDMSSMISAISGIVSSMTQALPSLVQALSSIDLTSTTPDLTQLTQALTQVPDIRAAISDSPEFAALMSQNPELADAARAIGLTIDPAVAVATPAAGLDSTEPATESARAAEAFPRASLPDFSNLGSLTDVITPIVAASSEIVAPAVADIVEEAVITAEGNADLEHASAEHRS